MATKTWKNHERIMASRVGSHRTPLSGSNSRHETMSDSLSDTFYIEAKYTGNPKSRYYKIAERLRKLPKLLSIDTCYNAIRVTYENQKIVAFQTAKKDVCIYDLNMEQHKNWRRLAIWKSFLEDPCKKAAQEHKIPLFAIKMKNKNGETIVCREEDFNQIKEKFHWHSIKR